VLENRAAVLHGAGDLRVEAVPTREPGEREVLVAIRAVGICGSDVHYYEHGRIGDFVVRTPMILGHESSGVVIARGPGATRHAEGQRVAIEPGVPDGRCAQCRAGRYNLCPNVRFLATPPIDGALTRYLVMHEDFVYPLPDAVSDDAGALIEPLSVGIWANRKAGTTTGSRVLVIGAGPIGVLAAQVARASGAAYVGLVEISKARIEAVNAIGVADEVIDAGAGPDLAALEPDILIECTGAALAVSSGIRALAPAGVAVLVGTSPIAEMPLPTSRIQARELAVTGTFRYANTYPAAIALAASGRVRLDEMAGAHLGLDETATALAMSHTHPEVLKTMVVIGN